MTTPFTFDARVAFDSGMAAWSVRGRAAGVAGGVSVLLDDDVRISFDAVEPDQLVELAVAVDTAGRAAAAAVDLVRKLAGSALADHLAERSATDAAAEDPVTVPVSIGAAYAAAAALARTRLLQSKPITRHPLRNLDEVLHRVEIDHPPLREEASEIAWRSWPAVASLARSCDDVVMLLAVPHEERASLRARLRTVQQVIAEDGGAEFTAGPGFRYVDRLVEALAPVTSSPPPAPPLRDLGVTGLAGAGAVQHLSGHRAGTEIGRPITWESAVDDYATSLGGLLRLLHDGTARATGHVPGELTVSVPVEFGVADSDLAEIRVRAFTPDGTLIGEQPLQLVDDPRRLPEARCVIALPATVDGADYATIDLDICAAALPPLDSAALTRLMRRRAARAGQSAVAAAAAGRHDLSAEYWDACANILESTGAADDAEQAAEHADAAARLATEVGEGTSPGAGTDWLSRVLDGWAQWTRAELTATDGADPDTGIDAVDRAARLVESLQEWDDPSTELADSHYKLAQLLQASSDPDPDEVEHHLRESLRINYALNRSTEALTCLRALAAVS